MEPHFDRWQFDGRRDMPVSAESRIDWSDYQRMGTQNGSVPLRFAGYVPAFAMNNEQLRAVILEMERRNSYAGGSGEQLEKHKQACARAGGYRAFMCAIAYRAWRLRRDSVAIAEEMDISPETVRLQLFRMQKMARELGFEATPPRKQNKEFTRHELFTRRKFRRETMRRRLYGKPDYVEGVHCWECRIRLIDHPTNKWRCAICLEKTRRVARARFRKNRGLSKPLSPKHRAKIRASHRALWAGRKSGKPK